MTQLLPALTRAFIDEQAIHLIMCYGSHQAVDYDRLAYDQSITVVKSLDIIVPACQSIPYGTAFEHYVFLPSHLSPPSLEEYFRAHEYGHILLGHTTHMGKRNLPREQKEEEAAYFAERLTGQPRPTTKEILASTRKLLHEHSDLKQRISLLPNKEERFRFIQATMELTQLVHILDNYT